MAVCVECIHEVKFHPFLCSGKGQVAQRYYNFRDAKHKLGVETQPKRIASVLGLVEGQTIFRRSELGIPEQVEAGWQSSGFNWVPLDRDLADGFPLWAELTLFFGAC